MLSAPQQNDSAYPHRLLPPLHQSCDTASPFGTSRRVLSGPAMPLSLLDKVQGAGVPDLTIGQHDKV